MEDFTLLVKFSMHYRTCMAHHKFLSFVDEKNEDFIVLKNMGKDIIPFLLYRICDSQLAMHLLSHLVGDEVLEVSPDERGKFFIIGEKWFKWGKDNGYC